MTAPTKPKPTALHSLCSQTHEINSKGEFGPCPKWKLKTGQCLAGFHEGKKPRDRHDNPIQVCKQWLYCPCDCHSSMTQMYQLADEERVWVDNPEYSGPTHKFYMPVFGVDYGVVKSSAPDLVSTPVTLEGTTTDGGGRYVDADTGRIARGGLEQMVLAVCTDYVREQPDALCTPQWIIERIRERYEVTAPSTGAISSVFYRWEKWDFALIGTKPQRFLIFTPEGAEHGMEYMRNQYKHSKG